MGILNIWLVQQEVKNDPYLQQQLLIRAYNKYGTYELFQNLSNTTQNGIKQSKKIGIKELAHQFFIQQQIYHHPDTKQFKNENGLTQLSKIWDEYFVARKLQFICLQISRKNFIQDQSSVSFHQGSSCLCQG